MTRSLVTVALLALSAVASAQEPTYIPIGPPVLGGRVVSGPPITDGQSALFPTPVVGPSRFSVGGGSLGQPPQLWLPSGPWGGVSYPWPVLPVVESPAVPATGVRGGGAAQSEATLVAQFPAAAEVWVGGKKLAGGPAAEWTLTSPAVAGQSHTFEVKARWTARGKTYETTRSLAVGGGERNRWIAIRGDEVKE